MARTKKDTTKTKPASKRAPAKRVAASEGQAKPEKPRKAPARTKAAVQPCAAPAPSVASESPYPKFSTPGDREAAEAARAAVLAEFAHKARQAEGMYTPEIGEEVCSLIAEGKTLNQVAEILSTQGVGVNRRTLLRWVDTHPAFAVGYAKAQQMQADWDADEIRDMIRRVIGPLKEGEDRLHHQDARLAIDALKWTASRRNPKKYGDKVEVDTPADGAIAKAYAFTVAALADLAKPKEVA
jgi:hypothetical protein